MSWLLSWPGSKMTTVLTGDASNESTDLQLLYSLYSILYAAAYLLTDNRSATYSQTLPCTGLGEKDICL